MRRLLAAALSATISLLSLPAAAMDFGLVRGGPATIISATGDITLGDDEKLHRFVAGLPADATLNGIVLNSKGGIITEAVHMADTIRASGLRTAVDGECASACFMLFAAGTTRYVFDNAGVGVHSANTNGEDTDSAKASTTVMARKSYALGATAHIIGRMVTTPPKEMAWLTWAELAEMGVRIVKPHDYDYEPGSKLRTGVQPPAPTPLG